MSEKLERLALLEVRTVGGIILPGVNSDLHLQIYNHEAGHGATAQPAAHPDSFIY